MFSNGIIKKFSSYFKRTMYSACISVLLNVTLINEDTTPRFYVSKNCLFLKSYLYKSWKCDLSIHCKTNIFHVFHRIPCISFNSINLLYQRYIFHETNRTPQTYKFPKKEKKQLTNRKLIIHRVESIR